MLLTCPQMPSPHQSGLPEEPRPLKPGDFLPNPKLDSLRPDVLKSTKKLPLCRLFLIAKLLDSAAGKYISLARKEIVLNLAEEVRPGLGL